VRVAWSLLKLREEGTVDIIWVSSKHIPVHTMKAHGRVEVKFCSFSVSALVTGEWKASRSGCFNLWKRVTGTHSIGGLVAFSYVLDATGTDKSKMREIA
jgi:hypothetical protein